MRKIKILTAGDSPALPFAAAFLQQQGFPCTDYGDSTHVLLNVPTRWVPESLPESATVIGGNLDEWNFHRKIDLLKDEAYLAENAALTADCTLRLLCQQLPVAFSGCEILIIGWGRIGKCLSAMLKALDVKVTVAARKSRDLGMAAALGYAAIPIGSIQPEQYRAIINTVPAPVLPAFEGNCIKIDLASKLGIAGEDVLWARGLPGKMLPESSGKLIGKCVARYLQEGIL